MKDTIIVILCLVLVVFMAGKLYSIDHPATAVPEKPVIEEPARINGKWLIITGNSKIIPPKIVYTTSYYISDGILWYKDQKTGLELPYSGDFQVLPDDNRNLEDYGVYDLDK